MGTSTGYSMPKGGNWTPLKNDANQFVQDPNSGAVTPNQLIQDYLVALGGAAGLTGTGVPSIASTPTPGRSRAAGATGAGGGGESGGGTTGGRSGRPRARSGLRVGANIGGFLSRVGTVGLTEALREVGLGHLAGRSAAEITSGLLDELAGPASTLDDQAARSALSDLNDELLRNAQTAAQVEQVLKGALDMRGLGGLLLQYFGHYIYRRFCRDFYERWVKTAGSGQTTSALHKIKSYITEALRTRTVGIDLTNVNWRGREGAGIIQSILTETCRVFEVST